MKGAVEGGGTTFRCAVASAAPFARAITHETSFATRDPASTLREVIAFFRAHPVDAIGLAMFGPIDLAHGTTLATPKPGWSNVAIAGVLRDALAVPVAVDTDVNAAALGESREGAAAGCDPALYVTVGTGIGGGIIANGAPVHGLVHPELGHMRVAAIDGDAFEGACPFHGRCLEGLASGPAIAKRAGADAATLSDDDPALVLAARYVGLGLANAVMTLSPRRIVLGGGVMERRGMRERADREMRDAIGTYLALPDDYVVAPGLARRSAIIGALHLA